MVFGKYAPKDMLHRMLERLLLPTFRREYIFKKVMLPTYRRKHIFDNFILFLKVNLKNLMYFVSYTKCFVKIL